MQRKKMTLRFDLDRLEDRRAWEYLQRLNPASMNRAVLDIIYQAAQASPMQDVIRVVIREELAAVLSQTPVQPVQTAPVCDDGTTDAIMDFLENFS